MALVLPIPTCANRSAAQIVAIVAFAVAAGCAAAPTDAGLRDGGQVDAIDDLAQQDATDASPSDAATPDPRVCGTCDEQGCGYLRELGRWHCCSCHPEISLAPAICIHRNGCASYRWVPAEGCAPGAHGFLCIDCPWDRDPDPLRDAACDAVPDVVRYCPECNGERCGYIRELNRWECCSLHWDPNPYTACIEYRHCRSYEFLRAEGCESRDAFWRCVGCPSEEDAGTDASVDAAD